MCTVVPTGRAAMVSRMQRGEKGFHPHAQAGLTYLWMLMALVLLGLGMGRTLEVYHQALLREREAELLHIGSQFRQAIGSYYQLSPGAQKQYPHALSELLHDERFLRLRRHIRRLHADPMNPAGDWSVVRNAGGGITGVFSRAPGLPQKQAGFSPDDRGFEGATSYAQWRFVFEPGKSVTP